MRRSRILMLILLAGLVSALSPQAEAGPLHELFRAPRKPGVLVPAPPSRRAEAPSLPTRPTGGGVVPVTCSADAQSAGANLCGYVMVPLDRHDLTQGTIGIYFEQYLHTGGGEAVSAIVATNGGPGYTTTGVRFYFLSFFGANLDVHDLVLIDDRGRGLSDAIDCPDLQHGLVPFDQAAAECAAQLGNAASDYGTGDVAEDAEAVRSALGYDRIDFYANSYAGEDLTAYATRFGGRHLRSIILDAPMGTPHLEEERFAFQQYDIEDMPRKLSFDCQSSPTCAPDHTFPLAEYNALVAAVQQSPVEGDAFDANGNLIHVRLDESGLLNYVINSDTGNFASTGEILAAARALRGGDSKPLLRLGAEGYFVYPAPTDYGDPTFSSEGAHLATSCADMDQPFQWSASIPERTEQIAEAVSNLPPGYFAPFSNSVANNVDTLAMGWARDCLYWEKPIPSSPVAPHPNPKYPLTPTLVLSGDLDTTVAYEGVSKVAALFPNSTLVSVAGAGHVTLAWTPCAVNLASEFIETLKVPDTSCANTPYIVWPAVGRLPLFARQARPAQVDPAGHNQIGLDERTVVTVALATATDALQRSLIGAGTGVGLRGGTFSTVYGTMAWTTMLTNCEFASDVTVNGTVIWGTDNSFTADLVLTGAGTGGGMLHAVGSWQAPGPVGNFAVSGKLGGKSVAVLVPEA